MRPPFVGALALPTGTTAWAKCLTRGIKLGLRRQHVKSSGVSVMLPGTGLPNLPTIPRPQGQASAPETFLIPQIRDSEFRAADLSGTDTG